MNKESDTDTNENVGTIDLGMAGYFGGLESVPNPEGIDVYFHDDKIEISFMESNSTLEIPYRDITSVENIDKNEIFYSLLRDRNFESPETVTYTLIRYKVNSVEHYVIIDFDKSFKFAMDFLMKKLK